MNEMRWEADWPSFVASVCRAFDAGLSGADIARQHAYRRVSWIGTVIDKKRYLDSTNVAVQMPDVRFQLRNGKNGQANYLALKVSLEDTAEWQATESGDRIVFETEIEMSSPDDPFSSSGIEWSDLDDNAGYFKFLTRNSRLIEVLGRV